MAYFRYFVLILLCCALACGPAQAQSRGPLILAAASLREALSDAALSWQARKHAKPVMSFAGSPVLARQVEAGAPADLFISADEAWMDYLARKGLIRKATRASFISTRLVLVVPATSDIRLISASKGALARRLGSGRLAMADPDTVPAGRYGKAALTSLGVWPSVSGRLVRVENVRAALSLIERGEVPFGIVYATDALASSRVRIVTTFPANSHPAISYPLALLAASTHPDAEGFRRFLLSREGKAIFARRGFITR